jgi:ectoine hydroxylase-related dioxygenase (phytanoyl-CoA dioxygenase family)
MNQKNFQVTFSNSKSFLSTINKVFEKYGVVLIKDLLKQNKDKKNLASSEVFSSALYFYKQTANKISIKTKISDDLKELDYYVKKLEHKDRQANTEALKLISKSSAMMNYSNNDELLKVVSSLLNIKKNNLLLESFGAFVPNLPSNTTRLYTWHSESHWLPYRKNFVNLWAPLFRKKKKYSGTMLLKPFSHKERHLFYEYQGYENKLQSDSYTQYEIIEEKKFEEVHINADDGDVVFFNQNLLHKSELNLSSDIGYLYVNRFFNIEKDLTISSNLNLRPYSSESAKIGRKLNIKNKY